LIIQLAGQGGNAFPSEYSVLSLVMTFQPIPKFRSIYCSTTRDYQFSVLKTTLSAVVEYVPSSTVWD
jgi:hypothetical protein